MSFMQPQFVETNEDTIAVCEDDIILSDCGQLGGLTQTNCEDYPDEYPVMESLISQIRADMENDGFFANIWYQDDHGGMHLQTTENHKFSGISWRLGAPGYMDCTDWTESETIESAVQDCLSMYGDGMDREDLDILASELNGFDEFWENYLIALGFTANKYETEDDFNNGNPEPLFSFPGCDISECISGDDVAELLSNDDIVNLMADCISFYIDAIQRNLISKDDSGRAGSDFHLTRNHHGAGFWDGDWKNGKELTELSHPYSTCELTVYGDDYHITN